MSSFATPLAAAPPGGPSSTFRVTGDVTKWTSFDVKALEALPVTKGNVTYFAAGVFVTQSCRGTLLWDVSHSVGIVVVPKIKNAIPRKAVIVTGSGGCQSVLGPNHRGACSRRTSSRSRWFCTHRRAGRHGWWPVCVQHREYRSAERRQVDR
jgi:hypothetical protein